MAVLDYTGTHANCYGVETATYTTPGGTEVTASAKVKRLGLSTKSAFEGATFGIEPTDDLFAFWNVNMSANVPESGGEIKIGTEIWNVLFVSNGRGDAAQWEVIARKE